MNHDPLLPDPKDLGLQFMPEISTQPDYQTVSLLTDTVSLEDGTAVVARPEDADTETSSQSIEISPFGQAILDLWFNGKNFNQIASHLSVTKRTITNNIDTIAEILGVSNTESQYSIIRSYGLKVPGATIIDEEKLQNIKDTLASYTLKKSTYNLIPYIENSVITKTDNDHAKLTGKSRQTILRNKQRIIKTLQAKTYEEALAMYYGLVECPAINPSPDAIAIVELNLTFANTKNRRDFLKALHDFSRRAGSLATSGTIEMQTANSDDTEEVVAKTIDLSTIMNERKNGTNVLFTAIELKVINLLPTGMTHKEIAGEIGGDKTEDSVKSTIQRARKRCGAKNSLQLYLMHIGAIPMGEPLAFDDEDVH